MKNKNKSEGTSGETTDATTLLEDNYSKDFISMGLRIAYFRKMAGKTQQELADEMGVSTSYIGQIEAPNIVKSITLTTLFRIAEHLNVPAYELLKFN